MKYYLFYFIGTGFLLGILFSSFVKTSFNFLIFFGIISIAVFGYLSARNFLRGDKHKLKIIFIIFLAIFSFFVGVARYEFREKKLEESQLRATEERKISIIGIVIDEPKRKGDFISFRLKVYSYQNGENIMNISPEFINIRTQFFKEVYYGDKIIVTGKISKIKNFESDIGTPFDYISYMKVFGVTHEISPAEVVVVGKSAGNIIVASFLKIKDKFIQNIEGALAEPDSSLVAGMVISGKKSLDKDLQNNFIKTGIIHIVVLSGYNIAIVVTFLLWLFSWFGRISKTFLIISGVLIFVIISGGEAPVVRAAVMALTVLILKITGRQSEAFRVLLFSAFIMVLWNPYALVFDISFELSFLAVLAVMYVSPIVRAKLTFVTPRYKLREIIGDTLGVQIFLLPFLVYKMGIVSLVALPVNILVLPLVPWIMLLGFIIGTLAFISYISFPFAVLAHLLIKIMLFIVNIFVAIPYSSINISHLSIVFPLTFYIIFGIYIFYLNRLKSDV